MVTLTGEHLDLATLLRISRGGERVSIDEEARERVLTSRDIVEKTIERQDVVYGINTGFGKLADEKIDACDVSPLQENLLRSHACGTGDILGRDVVRGMMVLRINALLKGYSGIRLKAIRKIIDLLHRDIVPVVYAQGSLGASGDLVPLAHMALPLIGEGEVIYQNRRLPAGEALGKAGLTPLDRLEAKEGLALINGTQAMLSIGAHALYDAKKTLYHANIAAGFSFEALQGIVDVFDHRIHKARNHEEQARIAGFMESLLAGSRNTTHQGDIRVQDAYSLRCVPSVHGASLQAFEYVQSVLEREMNAATDNPLLLADNESAVSAGNFHGQVLALPFDYLSIAVSELANISERRLERLVNHDLNKRFPHFLAKQKGKNSGFMIIQYVAASLVSENKTLAHPASVDSIPTSANQEDHVSMGTITARKAMKISQHVRKVVGLEMMSAAQALDFAGVSYMSEATRDVHEKIRQRVPHIEEDRMMQPLMDEMDDMLMKEVLINRDLEGILWKR